MWKGFKDVQATILVDVSRSEEELFKRADRSRRKNINKALKEGLIYTEAEPDEWKEWYKIYCAVWKNGGVNPQPFKRFQKPNYKLYLVKKR